MRELQAGKNIDPQKYRKQNEKVTDKIRQMIEKFTGKKVSFLRSRARRHCEGVRGADDVDV